MRNSPDSKASSCNYFKVKSNKKMGVTAVFPLLILEVNFFFTSDGIYLHFVSGLWRQKNSKMHEFMGKVQYRVIFLTGLVSDRRWSGNVTGNIITTVGSPSYNGRFQSLIRLTELSPLQV